MGKKDLYQSDFYENHKRFSDVFNGVLFGGQEVMKPEELEEADSVMVSLAKDDGRKKVICDKVRKWKGKYVSIMVLENQSYVDYQMVLRAMRTELLGYERQQRKAFEEAKTRGIQFDGHEYLSRMKREQKFIPVITLVLYMGTAGRWDGARSLHELLELEDGLKPFVSNYKLNLYDYHEHQDFSIFKTENRALFETLSCANDESRMEEALKRHPDWYSALDEESAKAIFGITGIRINLETIREVTEKGKEVFNVCKAFDDHMERGRREGKKEGRAEGRKEGRIEGKKEAVKSLMRNLSVSLEQAMELLGISEEERDKYLSVD